MSTSFRDEGDAYWLMPLERALAEKKRHSPASRARTVDPAKPSPQRRPLAYSDIVIRPQPRPVPAITQEMVDAMSPELISIGLRTGGLVIDQDGRVVPALDDETERRGGSKHL